MEVTVVDTGDLPPGAIISFHTGTVRRHAQIKSGKAIGVTGIGTEPVRVDLMTEVGSHTFDVTAGQDVYEVPISASPSSGAEDMNLKLQIRGAPAGKEDPTDLGGSGPSRKLQTALMMRSYLDNHDVLRQMQELLQDMVVSQPEDPIDYMIKRLEMVCKDSAGADYDLIEGEVAGTVEPAGAPKKPAPADSDSDDGADDGPDEPPPPPVQRKQRQSVSAEAYGAFNERKAYVPKVIEKDEAQTARLQEVLQACWMFKHHTPENMKIILDAMQEKRVEAGTRLIQEGDEGEVMWVIEDGELDCIKRIQGEEQVVKKCSRGDVFGELALLYNCKRAASVLASRACILWELDRETFNAICYEAAQKAPPEYEGFSAPSEAAAASSAAAAAAPAVAAPAVATPAVAAPAAAEEKPADDSDASDDGGDVEEPEAPVKKPVRPPGRRTGVSAEASKGDADDWEPPVYGKTPEERASLKVFQCGPGFAFGEMALLYTCPRSATITAQDDSEDQICSLAEVLEEEEFDDDEAIVEQGEKDDKMFILRNGQAVACIAGEKGEIEVKQYSKGEYFGEIALLSGQPRKASVYAVGKATCFYITRPTFKRILGPLQSFLETNMDKYAKYQDQGWAVNEDEDTHNAAKQEKKPKVVRKREKKQEDLHIEKKVVSEAGSEAPPETLADKVAQERKGLGRSELATELSEHFGKNWEEALKESFAKAQEDLEEFCKLHSINIEASGAAGSCLVLEEQTVHIAFIGDARIMLGSWNRRDSRMIFCTKEPATKARLEAEGSEVREVDEGSWRIYLKGSNFPGLTMSRAFGDTACAGISRVPEYHKFLMQPTDEWYAIVASDGIWEFIEGEECCNMTAKKLRLKGTRETVEFITSASRKRWAHVCGDYCDDITAVLVQWNSKAAEGGNHSVTVKQFQPPSS
eukprot:g10857.t1